MASSAHPRARAEGTVTPQLKAAASPGGSRGKTLPWAAPGEAEAPGGAILGAAPQALSLCEGPGQCWDTSGRDWEPGPVTGASSADLGGPSA